MFSDLDASAESFLVVVIALAFRRSFCAVVFHVFKAEKDFCVDLKILFF